MERNLLRWIRRLILVIFRRLRPRVQLLGLGLKKLGHILFFEDKKSRIFGQTLPCIYKTDNMPAPPPTKEDKVYDFMGNEIEKEMGFPTNLVQEETERVSGIKRGADDAYEKSRQEAQQSGSTAPAPPPKNKNKKFMRAAGGDTWEDPTLAEWDENDFRIFVGDLGQEVTDELLTKAFSRYVSFKRAKVVLDKTSRKPKGYGFVALGDPDDYIKAMREMQGHYIGARPVKLKKSCWKDRNLNAIKKKNKTRAKWGFKVI